MAKKKQKKQAGGSQQELSPEQYLRQRMRTVPISTCYATEEIPHSGIIYVVVTRRHTGGRVSAALFMVDVYCLGVKESFYRLWLEDDELEELLELPTDLIEFHECSYEEAHNRIYGAIAFAEEAGIKPDKSFQLTKYLLEEDTDDIPLIEYDYGRNGKHFLICDTKLEASRYLPILRKTLGEGRFDYLIGIDEDEAESNIGDEDDDYLQPGPVFMRDLVRRIGYDELYDYATALDLDVSEDMSYGELRQTYIDGVLDDPLTLLSYFSREDLNYLEELRDNPEWGNELPFYEGCITPLMVHYGFAEEGWLDDSHYVIRLASDFKQAVMGVLDEALNDEANMARLFVESLVEGLANLYGEVSPKEVVDYMKKHLGMEEQGHAEELMTYAVTHSMLLDWMVQEADSNFKPDDYLEDDDVVFVSRYGWQDDEAFRSERERRSKMILKPKSFEAEAIICASRAGFPVIPNKKSKQFEKFLDKQLKLEGPIIEVLCYDLWNFAQHEGDEEYSDKTVEDFFNEMVLDEIDDDKLAAEAIRQFHDYLDHIPRWVLKGYAPCEV